MECDGSGEGNADGGTFWGGGEAMRTNHVPASAEAKSPVRVERGLFVRANDLRDDGIGSSARCAWAEQEGQTEQEQAPQGQENELGIRVMDSDATCVNSGGWWRQWMSMSMSTARCIPRPGY